MTSAPERILIVNPFGIGDVLFTTPLVRALRSAFPSSRIAYLCNRRTEAILRHNPNVDELFIYEKDEVLRLWRTSRRQCLRYLRGLLGELRRRRFDLLVDLSLGERYTFILALLGIRRRAGFDYRRRGRFLTDRLPIDGYRGVHVVEHYRLLLGFIGVRLPEAALELHISPAGQAWAQAQVAQLPADRPWIGMVPAGGVSWGIDAHYRRWTVDGFARVGDALAERHRATVLLFGEAGDRPICQAVAAAMRQHPIDLSGQTTLEQFIGLLARLRLVVCNDGGPLHLAVSQGVPTVSVFGPVDPRVYGPYPPGDRLHQVVCYDELPCRPCYHQFKLPGCPYDRACLERLPPARVLAACEAVLERTDARALVR